jgi:hypothetical protein
MSGVRDGAVGWGTALKAGRLGVRFPKGLLGFLIDLIILTALCPTGVDSACNRNEQQGILLFGKGGRCVGLSKLPPSCADCI